METRSPDQLNQWLDCFSQKDSANVTLTLNGQSFKRDDFEEVGSGSEKSVYRCINQDKFVGKCFFIPNPGKLRNQKRWERLIADEKKFLDQICELGLRAQEFTITNLMITNQEGESFTIPVLVTTSFEALAKRQSLVIYNVKGDQQVTGERPDFYAMRERFANRQDVQQMLKKIIHEYVVAMTFGLPISATQHCDDSEHICFELPPAESKEMPVARYMFWDVVRDFGGVIPPVVPTLKQLRGKEREARGTPDRLHSLADKIAGAMVAITCPHLKKAGVKDEDFYLQLLRQIGSALSDNELLETILISVRQRAIRALREKLENSADLIDNKEKLQLMMLSAISTDDIDLVKQVAELVSSPADFPVQHAKEILAFAREYQQQPIIDYVSSVFKTALEKQSSDALVAMRLQRVSVSREEKVAVEAVKNPEQIEITRTIEKLKNYLNRQVTRLTLRENDFFNKGVADKKCLFEKVLVRVNYLASEMDAPNAEMEQIAKKLEGCIKDSSTIAHHHRYSKLDRCANFFRACMPGVKPIVAESWMAWKRMGDYLERGRFYQVHRISLCETDRPKNNYNNYRRVVLRR